MASTYTPIATTTLSSPSSVGITLSSIPSTYTDLRLVLVAQGTIAGGKGSLRFNNDTATNYSTTYISGDGATVSSSRYTNRAIIDFALSNYPASPKWGLSIIDIFSYAGSTYKTVLIQDSLDLNGSGTVASSVALWRSTAAINQINLIDNGAGFNTGTTLTLYGIKAA